MLKQQYSSQTSKFIPPFSATTKTSKHKKRSDKDTQESKVNLSNVIQNMNSSNITQNLYIKLYNIINIYNIIYRISHPLNSLVRELSLRPHPYKSDTIKIRVYSL